MHVVIYGRPSCPYCTRAKELATTLERDRNDFSYDYINIQEKGLTKEDLSKLVGKPVLTVPQIFIDKTPIGGCTDFEAYARENLSG